MVCGICSMVPEIVSLHILYKIMVIKIIVIMIMLMIVIAVVVVIVS